MIQKNNDWHPTEADYFKLEEKYRDLENRYISLYNKYCRKPLQKKKIETINEEEYEEQEEKICENCIFLKGTFCKYFGEYREPYYEQKESDCFEPHENL